MIHNDLKISNANWQFLNQLLQQTKIYIQFQQPIRKLMHKQSKSYQPGFDDFQSEGDRFVPSYIDKRNLNNNQPTAEQDQQQTPISQQAQDRKKMLMQRAGIGKPNSKQANFAPRNKWGKMLVIHDGSMSITLGPDYWCFIPTFICFCGVAFGTIYLVLTNVQSLVAKLAAFLVCFGQLLSYLLVATSNPGVVFGQQALQQIQQVEQKQRNSQIKYCRKCHFQVPKSSYHCRDCDVCIQGYDHHCPWTSKCIGGNNLCRFYTFLLMTPIFLVYVCVAFIMCMSQQVHQIGRQHITTSAIHNI